jgi:hypothetical protein
MHGCRATGRRNPDRPGPVVDVRQRHGARGCQRRGAPAGAADTSARVIRSRFRAARSPVKLLLPRANGVRSATGPLSSNRNGTPASGPSAACASAGEDTANAKLVQLRIAESRGRPGGRPDLRRAHRAATDQVPRPAASTRAHSSTSTRRALSESSGPLPRHSLAAARVAARSSRSGRPQRQRQDHATARPSRGHTDPRRRSRLPH